jgi:beta-lactamase regulating signal transducer with metallopeptidase domain
MIFATFLALSLPKPTALPWVEPALRILAISSLHAAVLAVLVAIVIRFFRDQLSASMRFWLWLLVFARLLVPIGVPIHLSSSSSPTPARSSPSPGIPGEGRGGGVFVETHPTAEARPHPNPPPEYREREPEKTPARSMNPTLVLGIVWLIGFAITAVRTIRAGVRLRRLITRLEPLSDERALAEIDRAARLLRIQRPRRVLVAPPDVGPALSGLVRPALLLPRELLNDLDPREFRLVLLHELAHLRRRDVPINCLVTLLAAVHWFNPLVWFAFARLREERELACDECVLAATNRDISPIDYGNVLLKLVQPIATAAGAVQAAPAAVGMFERPNRHSLNRRITMIAGYRTTGRRLHPILGICLLLIPLLAVAFTDAAGPAAAPAAAPGPAPTPNTFPYSPPPATQPAAAAAAATTQESRESKPDEPTIDPDTQGNAAQRAILDKRLPELNFNAIPFRDVVEFLRDVTGANIFINWSDLESAGISKDAAVTMRVRNVTFAKGLDLILESVSTNPELTYTVEGGVIEISTAARAEKKVVVQTYDVSRLAKTDAEMDSVKKLIVGTVDPSSWQDNGGPTGSIVQFKSKLVICQTPTNHQKIVAILQSVSDKGDEPVGAAAGTAGVPPTNVPRVQGVPVPAEMTQEAQKLWSDTYAPRIILVNGQPVNSKEIEDAFRKDVEERMQERGLHHY